MPSLPTSADLVNRIRQALATAEPDLDTSVGKPMRKLIDVFCEVMHENQIDTYLLDYFYDVDTKSGSDLDLMLSQFGFARLEAKRATGNITFARTGGATQDFFIPLGVQIATTDIVPLVAMTNTSAVLGVGETEVTVPAQMVLGGAEGNVLASKLVSLLNGVPGVQTVSNPAAFIGGADAENDESLRARFKATVFRNMAGTEQMFIGVSLEDPDVTQVNVVAASKRHFEQLEVVSGAATSEVQDSIYTYPDSSFFGQSVMTGDLLIPGVHYDFDPQPEPEINIVDSAITPDGIYELEFDYVSRASRNDAENGVTNRIDVWVNGVRVVEAVETIIFDDAAAFNNTSSDPLYRQNYRRANGAVPTNGNFLIRLGFSPVYSLTETTITIDGTDYEEGTDFFLVNDISPFGMAPRSRAGLEWKSTGNGGVDVPTDGVDFVMTYNFNEVPTSIEAALQRWRLVGTDVWVHQAVLYFLKMWLAVIISPGWDPDVVEAQLGQVIGDYLRRVQFNGVVQVSDILAVAHSVNGVDNVRFFTSADHATNFGIARVTPDDDETIITNFNDAGTPKRATDIPLGDDEVAVLSSIVLDIRAQNTFGVV